MPRRKRIDLHLNLSVMLFDCPLATPDMVRESVWEVVRSRARERQLFRSIMARLTRLMQLPGYAVKQDGRTYREGK